MSPTNPYVELLAQFQEEYAALGCYYLSLAAVTTEELADYPFLRDTLVGVVIWHGSAWYIVGEIIHASRFGAGEAYCKLRAATLEAFCQLASRAGAALPLSIRSKIPGYPDDTPAEPLSWWLTFLWHVFPPSKRDLTPTEGEGPPVRVACLSPFQASIDAIEFCKLHTDQPRFQPGERPDTITAHPSPEPWDKGNVGHPRDQPALSAVRMVAQVPLPAEKTEDGPHADGPEGGRWLWWNNKRYDVPHGIVYRLLDYMWHRDSASYDDLEDAHVFNSAVVPQTVRSYANKMNNALPTGFPWRFSADSVGRQLTKVPAAKNVCRESLKNP